MAIKSKKSHKLTTIIITLCILIPAFLLVLFYPKIRTVMEEEKAKYEKINQELHEKYGDETWIKEWHLESDFVNYAMESCFYLYNTFVYEGEPKDLRVFNDYGWIKDYFVLKNDVFYEVEYTVGNETKTESNHGILESQDTLGYLTIEFGSNGYLEDIMVEGDVIANLGDARTLYEKAMMSVTYFSNNVEVFNETYGEQILLSEYTPKNFTMRIALEPNSDFVYSEDEYVGYEYYSYESLLWDSGAIVLIIIAAIFVALMALILPFFKKLETGKEKLFSIPFEFVVGIGILGVLGTSGMFHLMAFTCGVESYPSLEILQFKITEQMWYVLFMILNFLGWAIVFFAEYIVVSSLRQLISNPKQYVKNRVLCVWLVCWIGKLCIKLYRYVTNIDINEKLNGSIIKIVLANFVILTILCTLWFFGIVGLVIYSVVLYVLLRKFGEKIQNQYRSILHATQQMAEGNLKISLEKDLGLFQPIGDSLNDVQKGFEKAVIEEAKSQNMKTELITNVSHDLKTPLTAIITYVDLLKKDDITEEERKAYVRTLEQKSNRLKVLIEDLFEVSKAHSGNVTMNFMDVDVVSLMKQIRMEMEDQIEVSNLTFRWNLPEEKVVLSLDGQKTYRIFENLLSNALKYAMPHSRVYVDVLQSAEEVNVVFRNTSEQELNYEPEQLTERFVRGDMSRNSEGSGLGLAIAKSFVELQHGKMNIEIDGDLFKVTLVWKR